MKAIFLGIYTLILVFVWVFYVIANIHAKKFENFSPNIKKVSSSLFIFLMLLSIFGFLFIIFGDFKLNNINFNNFGGDTGGAGIGEFKGFSNNENW